MNQQVDKTPQIAFQAHPKERGQRPPTALFCGCSCCCCCCLHSIGGLVGAAKGANTPEPLGLSESALQDPDKVPNLVGEEDAGLIYWAILAGLTVAPFFLAQKTGLILSLVLMPLVQLVASAITYIYLRVNGGENRQRALRKLGRITKAAFVGGLIGFAVIVVLIGLVGVL